MTWILLISVLFIASFVIWQYVFSIYEVKVVVKPQKISLGDLFTVNVVPLNSFGNKAPLRNCESSLSIIKGENSVKLIEEKKGLFSFRAVSSGKVVFHINSKFSLETNSVELEIR